LFAFVLIASSAGYAQSAAFTFQGRLTDSHNPADGLYDMRFKLYDTPDIDTGTQQGTTLSYPTVQVMKGVFSVQLDFGPNVFNGSARYLEISIRPTGNLDPHIILGPRQPIASTPYAVKSMSATSADELSGACVGCVTSSQIQSISANQITTGTLPVAQGGTGLSTTGPNGWFLRSNNGRWTSLPLSSLDLPAGSSNYIQNSSSPQAGGSTFNVSGNGVVGGILSVGTPLPFSSQYKMSVITPGAVGLRVQTGAFGGTVASFGGAGDFEIDSNGVEGGRLTVEEDGKVGIGTTNPSDKLTVDGTIRSLSGGFKFPDGTTQTTAAQPSAPQSPPAVEAYTAFRAPSNSVEVAARGGQPAPIIGLSLPAGSYIISATVDFLNSANSALEDDIRQVQCTLADESWNLYLGAGLNQAARRLTWGLHTVKTFNQPITLQIDCVAQSGGTGQSFVVAQQRRLTATRVSSVVTQ
jgi:hypothetical protein